MTNTTNNIPTMQVEELFNFNISNDSNVVVDLLLSADELDEEMDEAYKELDVVWIQDMSTEELLKLMQDKCKEFAS